MKNNNLRQDVYLDYNHPILDDTQFMIETPATIDLLNEITRLIWLGGTGASVIGFSCAGKTTALIMIQNKIISRSGKTVPVIRHYVHRRDQKTIKQLLKNILNRLDIDYLDRDAAEDMVERLTIFMVEKAHNYNSKNILFVVDEAQRLNINQIDLFAELFDILKEAYSILLTVVFVGNREQLSNLLKTITNGDNEHIEGRFFRRVIRFHGIRNHDDVRFCLSQYDKIRFPAPDGPSCTEYFLSDDCANGFLLEHLSSPVWSVFKKYKKDLQIEDWGMKHFTQAIKILLTDYLHNQGATSFSIEMFEHCIEVSDLVSDLITIKNEL